MPTDAENVRSWGQTGSDRRAVKVLDDLSVAFKLVPLNEAADHPPAIVIRCAGVIVRKRPSRDSYQIIANKGDSHEVHQYLECTSRHLQCSSRTLPRNRWCTARGRQDVGALAWHGRQGICDL